MRSSSQEEFLKSQPSPVRLVFDLKGIKAERTSIGANALCSCGGSNEGEVIEQRYLNFNEFFDIMKERIVLERHTLKDVEFESHSSNVSCMLWPS